MIQRRREEDQEDEERLRELQNRLAEMTRRISDRKRERQIEEEVARLRRSEQMARELAREESGTGNAADDSDEPQFRPARRAEERRPDVAQPTASNSRYDDWIGNLSEKKPSRLAGESAPRFVPMHDASPAYTCSKPFDGDPRDWPLFSSRFKALVHDVLPDDAQRVAILSDWLGPNVRRRIETLLTAPQGYAAALEFLRKQYGKPEKVSRCRIVDLLNLPACKPNDLPMARSSS